MESSTIAGIMAVFAVSAGVVTVAHQVHKRLLSEFMKKVELELGGGKVKCQSNKKVRFADDVVEPSLNNKEYQERHSRLMLIKVNAKQVTTNDNASKHKNPNQVSKDNMPLNRHILYKGIIEYKAFNGYYVRGFRK
ncbi:uncharacterized protein LOC122075789 [Macadamia integrifolia]|uniref:uncharacterized protein LOC122075789 n=1 Tax=Macadamia integrifolia TaxID=60698 RepID=UPI001C4EF260|nr:uncharacterized protein LOC122075789 [Macadamia integrifolia]